MNDDHCGGRRCKRSIAITYLGVDLCDPHWFLVAEDPETAGLSKQALAKILSTKKSCPPERNELWPEQFNCPTTCAVCSNAV